MLWTSLYTVLHSLMPFPSLANPTLCPVHPVLTAQLRSSDLALWPQQLLTLATKVCHTCFQAGSTEAATLCRWVTALQGEFIKWKKRACFVFIKFLTFKITLCVDLLYLQYDFWESCASSHQTMVSFLMGSDALTCFPFFVLSNAGCQVSVQIFRRQTV